MKILVLILALILVRALKLDETNFKDLPKCANGHKQTIINHHNAKDVDNTLIYITIKKISLNNFKHKICRHKQKHLILLLLLAGDVESNPGPVRTVRDKCNICNKSCTRRQRAIQCDTCDEWYHAACLHMNTPVYMALENKDVSWHCVQCGMPQFSSGLFNSQDLDTTNPYSSLTDPNISNLDLHKPLARSTPVKIIKKVLLASNNKSQRTPSQHKLKLASNNKSNETPNQHKLKSLTINFQSIKNKTADLEYLINKEEPDIIAGSETWLNPDIYNTEILSNNYEIFRKDRSDSHGGVLLAIKSNLVVEEIKTKPNNNIEVEAVYCKISLPNSTPLIIGSVYRPPNSTIEYMTDMCNELSNIKKQYKNAVIWIMGDFNLPDINWNSYTIDKHQYSKEINELFINTIQSLNLEQVTKQPTRNHNILDLFLTNRPGLVIDYEIIPGLSDHDIVRVNNRIKALILKKPKRIIYLWNKCNTLDLHQAAIKFQNIFLAKYSINSPVEDIWQFIKANLKELMDNFVPTKQTTNKINKCWFNTKLKKLCKQKENLFKKYKATKSERLHKRYLKIKHLTQKLSRQLQSEYVNNLIAKDNNKNLWSFIKSRKMETTGIAPLKGPDNITHNDNETKANILNTHFASSFSNPGDKDISINLNKIEELGNINIEEKGINKLLAGLKQNKASGPDDIPARLLKELNNELSPIFTILFQASVNQGKVPKDWKLANVTPLFKKGDKSDPGNYRPVSLTSITCKILEHIIYSSIVNHLDKNNVLCPHQHGFRKNRSCETQLIGLIDDLSKGLDGNTQIDAILLDFSKAFDKVHHTSLLKKLKFFGISGPLHQWIQDFLIGREQTVIVNGSKSSSITVNSGVPQGTVLGPLLFLIYINDLPNCINIGTKVRLFADDCIIYRTIKTEKDSEVLQRDLDEL